MNPPPIEPVSSLRRAISLSCVYTDDLYQSITPDEFFAQIAAGAMPKTSQVSVGEYEEFWEPFVAEG